jgi:uncharacterized protein DUF6916
MTVSRRLFIKAASGAALIASLPQSLVDVFSQDKRKAIQGGPAGSRARGIPLVSYSDPFYYYTSAAYSSYLGSFFRVYVPQRKYIDLKLIDVSQLKPAVPGKEGFSLVFQDTAANRLTGGLYQIEHAAMGTLSMMLGPVNQDGTTYEVVINRQYS